MTARWFNETLGLFLGLHERKRGDRRRRKGGDLRLWSGSRTGSSPQRGEGRGGEGGRQENRRGRGRADSSCERFCRLNTNSTIVLHKLITGKQNADLYTNVRDYYFPAVSYFPHLDYFLSYWKAATDKSQSPAANPPDHTPTTDHKTSLSPVLRSETTERKKPSRVGRWASADPPEHDRDRQECQLCSSSLRLPFCYISPPLSSFTSFLSPPSSGLSSALFSQTSLQWSEREDHATARTARKVSLLAKFSQTLE